MSVRFGGRAEQLSSGATEPSEVRAEVAGQPPPAADGYMYVCEGPGAAPRYECAFEPAPHMEQGPFDDHMFGEFGKERHVAVVVGDIGELYRDELPAFAPAADHKRKDEPLLLQAVEAAPAAHPPPPPPATSKKSDKKKSDNNGIKKKKTRLVPIFLDFSC